MKIDYAIALTVLGSIVGALSDLAVAENDKFHFSPSECTIREVLSEDQTIILKQLTCKHTVVKQ